MHDKEILIRYFFVWITFNFNMTMDNILLKKK